MWTPEEYAVVLLVETFEDIIQEAHDQLQNRQVEPRKIARRFLKQLKRNHRQQAKSLSDRRRTKGIQQRKFPIKNAN